MAPLRVAVVSTPRSGNTWVREMLAAAYAVPSISFHEMTAADWANLPPEFALQIHWLPDADFLTRLADHGVKVVTVARHPLDVLISILHVAVYDIGSERWLQARGGDETGLFGAAPRTRAFAEYAASARAADLLGVTPAWWDRPGVARVRYEDMVADPVAGLKALEPAFGPARTSWDAVRAKTNLGELRKTAVNGHFWKGRPGLWRELLPPAEATELAWHVKPTLDALQYTFAPDPALTAEAADRTWAALTGPELGRTLRKNSEGHRHQIAVYAAAIAFAERERDAAFADRDAAAADRAAAAADRDAISAERDAVAAARDAALRDHDAALADWDQVRTERDAYATARDLAAARADDLDRAFAAARARESHLAEQLQTAEATAAARAVEYAAAAAAAEQALVAVRAELKAEEFRAESLTADLAELRGRLAELTAAFAQETATLQAARASAAAADYAAGLDLAAARAATAASERRELVTRAELTDALGFIRDLQVERDTARRNLVKLQAVAGNIARELDKFRGLQGFSVRTAWRVQRLRDNLPKVFGFFKAVSRR